MQFDTLHTVKMGGGGNGRFWIKNLRILNDKKKKKKKKKKKDEIKSNSYICMEYTIYSYN